MNTESQSKMNPTSAAALKKVSDHLRLVREEQEKTERDLRDREAICDRLCRPIAQQLETMILLAREEGIVFPDGKDAKLLDLLRLAQEKHGSELIRAMSPVNEVMSCPRRDGTMRPANGGDKPGLSVAHPNDWVKANYFINSNPSQSYLPTLNIGGDAYHLTNPETDLEGIEEGLKAMVTEAFARHFAPGIDQDPFRLEDFSEFDQGVLRYIRTEHKTRKNFCSHALSTPGHFELACAATGTGWTATLVDMHECEELVLGTRGNLIELLEAYLPVLGKLDRVISDAWVHDHDIYIEKQLTFSQTAKNNLQFSWEMENYDVGESLTGTWGSPLKGMLAHFQSTLTIFAPAEREALLRGDLSGLAPKREACIVTETHGLHQLEIRDFEALENSLNETYGDLYDEEEGKGKVLVVADLLDVMAMQKVHMPELVAKLNTLPPHDRIELLPMERVITTHEITL